MKLENCTEKIDDGKNTNGIDNNFFLNFLLVMPIPEKN